MEDSAGPAEAEAAAAPAEEPEEVIEYVVAGAPSQGSPVLLPPPTGPFFDHFKSKHAFLPYWPCSYPSHSQSPPGNQRRAYLPQAARLATAVSKGMSGLLS